MNWKKLFEFLTGLAKIISFISLALSLYMKITALIGTTKKKDEDDDGDGDGDGNDAEQPEKTEEASDEN